MTFKRLYNRLVVFKLASYKLARREKLAKFWRFRQNFASYFLSSSLQLGQTKNYIINLLRTPFKITVSLAFCFLMFTSSLSAQDMYEKSIGLRGGFLSGVTYKQFLAFAGAIEGIVGYNFQNGRITTVTGLYEHHLFINYNTNLYGGGGLTLGANKDVFRTHAEAIVGIEYLMERFPMSITLDYKPAYNIFDNEFYFDEFALSVRYVF